MCWSREHSQVSRDHKKLDTCLQRNRAVLDTSALKEMDEREQNVREREARARINFDSRREVGGRF
jgi:uncharacterized protein YktB (UPF0637 family)